MSYKGHKPTKAMERAMRDAMLEIGVNVQDKRAKNHELKPGFLRPLYQGTSIENNTVSKLHENDHLREKRNDKRRSNKRSKKL